MSPPISFPDFHIPQRPSLILAQNSQIDTLTGSHYALSFALRFALTAAFTLAVSLGLPAAVLGGVIVALINWRQAARQGLVVGYLKEKVGLGLKVSGDEGGSCCSRARRRKVREKEREKDCASCGNCVCWSWSSKDNAKAMPEAPEMSSTTKDILAKVRKMVPPMLEKFHKGQMGRVAVIGGSEDYTGAPYFSAMASARLGADMSHVICEPQAAQVIKTYSPNLMVHPLMRQSSHASSTDTASDCAKGIIDMLPRLHVLVIGPGLGRDKLMQDTCAEVIKAAKEKNIPFVLDADGLFLAQSQPDLVKGYKECILTPNVVEFGRLCKAMDVDSSNLKGGEGAKKLANALGGVTIIQKGAVDYISNGEYTYESDLKGGLKRSGGQGDTLTGTLATFLGWRKAYLDKLWEHDGSLEAVECLALAAFGGSSVTRECSRLAFKKRGRSLQASDLTEEVEVAFGNLFDVEDAKDSKL